MKNIYNEMSKIYRLKFGIIIDSRRARHAFIYYLRSKFRPFDILHTLTKVKNDKSWRT